MAETFASRSGGNASSLRLAQVDAKTEDYSSDASVSKKGSSYSVRRKREAGEAGFGAGEPGPRSKRGAQTESKNQVLLPARYELERPKSADLEAPRGTIFQSIEPVPLYTPDGKTELLRPVDHPHNVKNYRYQHCIADPLFKHKQYFRSTEAPPIGPRLSFEDSDKVLRFDKSGTVVSNPKGWRSSRANVWAREGRWYMEMKVLEGIPPVDEQPSRNYGKGTQPRVRVGFSRREAPLDSPVGFDAFSYGVADNRIEAMHRSRPQKVVVDKQGGLDGSNSVEVALPHSITVGDVVGLEICLPSVTDHYRVVTGSDRPMVQDVVRDRIPIPFRGLSYFEAFEYQPTKSMEQFNDRSLQGPQPASQTGSQAQTSTKKQEADPCLRTLPGSYISLWLNGKRITTIFDNLLAFLPPASSVPVHPAPGLTARPNLDDGSLGYYPTVSTFSGGAAKVNFGPTFECPPDGLAVLDRSKTARFPVAASEISQFPSYGHSRGQKDGAKPLRPFSERFSEQVAEDVVWDLVDEASFYVQDGGKTRGMGMRR